MILVDTLRVPPPLDPTAPAYKDWLHLNVFDHRSGAVGLVNTSLHGPPGDPRTRVVGAALFDVPEVGWVGNLVVRGLRDARIDAAAVGLDTVGLAVDHTSGTIVASADLPDDRFALAVKAVASEDAVTLDRPLPLGSGWVSWYVLPRLAVTGNLRVGDTALSLDGASAYHDHNWGRWHWGDDFGWDWGSFHTDPPGPAVVFARTTDRLRRRPGPAFLLVSGPGTYRRFTGATVDVRTEGRMDEPARRVPGAMAALRSDRAAPRLPARVRITAGDGVDRVEVDFTARGCTQLILADPVRRGHSFVHESTGTFTLAGRLGGVEQSVAGLGVIEHVD